MGKPKLLFVSPYFPRLKGPGAPMRAASQIMALAAMFDVTLAIVSDYAGEADPETFVPAYLRTTCVSVIVINRISTVERVLRRAARGERLLEALWPLPRGFTAIGPGMVALAKRLAGQRFDVVHCFRLRTARFPRLMRRYGVVCDRAVLDFDDYQSRAMFGSLRPLAAAVGKRLAAARGLEAAKWAMLESRLIPGFDDAYVCSAADRARLARRFPRNRWHVVPNVMAEPMHARTGERDRFTFLFVGLLSYPPNTDAVLFFCEHVLTIQRRRAPAPFRVLIVGHDPSALSRLRAITGVEIVAGPPDVAPYYAQADVAIVPLRAGGGTRIKILEAFAFGLPVISTTVGAEGLDVTSDRDILIADGAEAFADQCCRLWADDALRRRIAAAGHELWRRRYTPAALEAAFAALFADRTDHTGGGIAEAVR